MYFYQHFEMHLNILRQATERFQHSENKNTSVRNNRLQSVNCAPLTIVKLNEIIQVSDRMKSLTYNPVFTLHCPHEINFLTQQTSQSELF